MKTTETQSINKPAFQAKGITKTFVQGPTRLEVLRGVDLDLTRGEMVAIIGASGSGKTTLLQILGGLDYPTSGSMLYNDEDIFLKGDRKLSEFRNQTIGFVFQFHHLLPEFTALENTVMPGLIAGMADRTKHKIGELSGGEQQRVALARAIIMKPTLLLADEPTGNLDPDTGNMVFELIRKLNREMGLITVMVTHNYELAERMDRCLSLEKGILQETAPAT
jgi:lipoprotein-releasing system ATP-binding protein